MAEISAFDFKCAVDRIGTLSSHLEEVRELFLAIRDGARFEDFARAEFLASMGWQFVELVLNGSSTEAERLRKVLADTKVYEVPHD